MVCGEKKDIGVVEQKKNKRGWPAKVMLRQLWPPPRLGSFFTGSEPRIRLPLPLSAHSFLPLLSLLHVIHSKGNGLWPLLAPWIVHHLQLLSALSQDPIHKR